MKVMIKRLGDDDKRGSGGCDKILMRIEHTFETLETCPLLPSDVVYGIVCTDSDAH
jgi:hypothetical protein